MSITGTFWFGTKISKIVDTASQNISIKSFYSDSMFVHLSSGLIYELRTQYWTASAATVERKQCNPHVVGVQPSYLDIPTDLLEIYELAKTSLNFLLVLPSGIFTFFHSTMVQYNTILMTQKAFPMFVQMQEKSNLFHKTYYFYSLTNNDIITTCGFNQFFSCLIHSSISFTMAYFHISSDPLTKL